MRLIYWGIGDTFYNANRKMENFPGVFNDEIISYVDNDPKLWGRKCNGKIIIPPKYIRDISYDKIIITSIYEKQIKKQLIDELNVDEEKIMLFNDYFMIKFAENEYKIKYSDFDVQNRLGFDMRKIVVYTAIIGDYDDLKEPEFVDSTITYVCFTDNKNLKSNVWNMEYLNERLFDGRQVARMIKIQPHIYFRDFETSVWVDGKFHIKEDIRKYIGKYEKDQPILCFPHFERKCIYSEAAECISSNRGDKQKIINQICHYYTQNYPFDNGMYETGCMIREHNNEICEKIMDDWKKEVLSYSLRDQISFPYVCWKNKFKPDICDLFINNNRWLQFVWHKRYY